MNALCVGNHQHAEMLPLYQFLTSHESITTVKCVADCAAACTYLADENQNFDLVVVFQTHSDEFSSSDVHALMSHLPLARWVCCCGVWCESDGRNRDIWPAAMRVPARVALSRLYTELRVINGQQQPLPWTASIDERFTYDFVADITVPNESPNKLTSSNNCPFVFHIQTADRPYREFLCDFFHSLNLTVVAETEISESNSQTTVMIWDIDPISPKTCADVESFQSQNPTAILIATTSMAHAADLQRAQQLGVAAVIDKLTPLAEFWATICKVTTPHHSASA